MRKKSFLLIYFFFTIAQIRAVDTLMQTKKFTLGVFLSPFSVTNWKNTQEYIIENPRREGKQTFNSLALLKPLGLNVNWNFYRNLYIETGLHYSEEFIESLADILKYSPLGPKRSVSLSYKVQYLQIPFSFAYISHSKHGLYFSIGVKNNFIYYEHLYGWKNYAYYDISNDNIKFNNIIVNMNVGGNIYSKKERFRFLYFLSIDAFTLLKSNNSIVNFEYNKWAIMNVAIYYNFNY